ncbi:MAG: hypothetical protein H6842_12210 [Rhodospirillaceae bacterium]|nr:hypothetical protein [Rhodospirillaceae bacterium]
MSWSRRRAAALLASAFATALAGACGFRPLYGETPAGTAAAAELASIEVGVIADRPGQQLRSYLLERLNPGGRPVDPRYRLVVNIAESRQSFAVLADDTVSRYNLIVVASFLLLGAESQDVLLERSSRATASYNVLDDQYATLSSERTARERALEAISNDIRTQLALYFQRSDA